MQEGGRSIIFLKVSWGRGDSLSKPFQWLTTLICLLFRQPNVEKQFLHTSLLSCTVSVHSGRNTLRITLSLPNYNRAPPEWHSLLWRSEDMVPWVPAWTRLPGWSANKQRNLVPLPAAWNLRLIHLKWPTPTSGGPPGPTVVVKGTLILGLQVTFLPSRNHSREQLPKRGWQSCRKTRALYLWAWVSVPSDRTPLLQACAPRRSQTGATPAPHSGICPDRCLPRSECAAETRLEKPSRCGIFVFSVGCEIHLHILQHWFGPFAGSSARMR